MIAAEQEPHIRSHKQKENMSLLASRYHQSQVQIHYPGEAYMHYRCSFGIPLT